MEEKNMNELLKKAEVLIEALPYIQRFNRKIIVVKYGGSAMVDEELKQHVIQDVTLLKLVGFKPIIVHGGGKEISRWVEKAGMEPEFVNGLRKTDEATMEIAEMVLNKVNKSLVKLVQELGVNAVGISGKDGGMLKVEKKIFQRTGYRLRRRDHTRSTHRFYMIFWKKIFFRSSAQSAWMKTMTATTSMQMMQPVRLREQSTQKN